jgi:tetratricopeptide (TPR) repeat protein
MPLIILLATAALATPAASEFDDSPAPFVAGKARGEAQVDRVEALAHFAAGRTFQQRGDFPRTLREYARADRLDPSATTARSNLVAAAVQEKQFAVAARYALKGIDPREVGEMSLGRLAIYFTERGDLPHAIEFYEKAIATSRGEKPTDAAANTEEASDIFTRLELGRLYHLTQNYAKAAVQFAGVNEALEHPDRFGINERARKLLLGSEAGECYELFGEAFLMADRFAEAEAAFRKLQAAAPDDALLKFNLARIAARRGKTQEALAGLKPYLDGGLTTEGAVPYQLLAELLKKLGREGELLDRLQKLHAARPSNVSLSYFLAEQLLGTVYSGSAGEQSEGKAAAAERLYLELSAKSPTMLAYRGLAEIYRKGRQYDKLLALLGRIMTTAGTLEALGPEAKPLITDARLFANLAEAGRKKVKDAAGKLEAGEFYVLGTLAQEQKQHDAANEFFEVAVKADPSKAAEVLLAWGLGLMIDNRAEEAVKVFQRGLDMKVLPESSPVFHYYLSGALAASNRMEQAVAAARLAAEKNDAAARLPADRKSDSARFASRLPWVLFHAKRYNEARQEYEKLFARYGGERDSVETLAVLRESRLQMSALSVVQGRLEEGEEWLQQVLDLYPDDVEADNDLGFLWADENRHLRRALKMIAVAVAAEPENRAYRDSLGWIFYRLGRLPEAVAELKKAIDDKQPDGTILEHLGDAYEKLGRHGEAVAAWERAVAALKKDNEPEKAAKVAEKMARAK